MCKSLVLKNMPLNESKHSESLRIKIYSKDIGTFFLLARSTVIQQGPTRYALSLSTLSEAGVKSFVFTRNLRQLEVFQHDREKMRMLNNQQLLNWQKRVPAHVCVAMKLYKSMLALCYYQCAAPALSTRFTSPN